MCDETMLGNTHPSQRPFRQRILLSLWVLISWMHLATRLQSTAAEAERPSDFVRLDHAIPDIVLDLKYATTDNFTGQVVAGYETPACWITRAAANALVKVQEELRPMGLSLMVFDAFRPQKAVDFFVAWSLKPDESASIKARYYPKVAKKDLFPQGFISEKSGHTRGSTVDLTLCSLSDDTPPQPLDMGAPFDFFGEASATRFPELSGQQRSNRLLLKTLMEKHGFKPYTVEWWHFTLRNEPYPETYFDFSLAP